MQESGEDLSKVAGLKLVPIYGAPVLILFSTHRYPPFGAVSAPVAAENMLLEATGWGRGSDQVVSVTTALNGEGNRNPAREGGVRDDYGVRCAIIGRLTITSYTCCKTLLRRRVEFLKKGAHL